MNRQRPGSHISTHPYGFFEALPGDNHIFQIIDAAPLLAAIAATDSSSCRWYDMLRAFPMDRFGITVVGVCGYQFSAFVCSSGSETSSTSRSRIISNALFLFRLSAFSLSAPSRLYFMVIQASQNGVDA